MLNPQTSSGNESVLCVVGPFISDLGKVIELLHSLPTGSVSSVDLLNFSGSASSDSEFLKEIEQAHPVKTAVIPSSELFSRTAPRVRSELSTWVYVLRQRLLETAQSEIDKDWSRRLADLWWLTPFSTRNSPGDDFWWELFRLAAVEYQLQQRNYSWLLIGDDGALAGLLQQLAVSSNLSYRSLQKRSQGESTGRLLAARLRGCCSLSVAARMARWKESSVSRLERDRTGEKNQVVLFSWFPTVWTRRFGSWQDMYYGKLPRLLESSEIEFTWAFRIYDKTKHLSPLLYSRRLQKLAEPWAPGNRTIVESSGTVSEIVRNYCDLSDWKKFKKTLESAAREAVFRWRELDLSEMILPKLRRTALVEWPHLQILRANVSRLVSRLRPQAIVLYCFEFVYGRAIIEGCRQGAPSAKVFGLQHGPISAMKLLYAGDRAELTGDRYGPGMPQPDDYVVDGELARCLLLERGVSGESIHVTGPARLDTVWEQAASRRDRKRPNQKWRVLVAPGLHDTEAVLNLALPALISNENLETVVKVHPKVSEEKLQKWFDWAARKDSLKIVKSGEIYEWMQKSDLFLATYSSTGVEAIAFGLPVILILPRSTPDMSLFFDSCDQLMTAASGEELADRIREFISGPQLRDGYQESLCRFFSRCFGPADSQASERLFVLIANSVSR